MSQLRPQTIKSARAAAALLLEADAWPPYVPGDVAGDEPPGVALARLLGPFVEFGREGSSTEELARLIERALAWHPELLDAIDAIVGRQPQAQPDEISPRKVLDRPTTGQLTDLSDTLLHWNTTFPNDPNVVASGHVEQNRTYRLRTSLDLWRKADALGHSIVGWSELGTELQFCVFGEGIELRGADGDPAGTPDWSASVASGPLPVGHPDGDGVIPAFEVDLQALRMGKVQIRLLLLGARGRLAEQHIDLEVTDRVALATATHIPHTSVDVRAEIVPHTPGQRHVVLFLSGGEDGRHPMLQLLDNGVMSEPARTARSWEELNRVAEKARRDASECARTRGDPSVDAIAKFRRIGRDLHVALFGWPGEPDIEPRLQELAKRLAGLPDGTWVDVYAVGLPVPWGLVYDAESDDVDASGFWALRFRLTRVLLAVSGIRPDERLVHPVGLQAVLNPTLDPAPDLAREHRAFLEGLSGAEAPLDGIDVLDDPDAFATWLDRLDQVSHGVIYFLCHGVGAEEVDHRGRHYPELHAEHARLCLAAETDAGSTTVWSVARIRARRHRALRDHPVVFVNACEAGRHTRAEVSPFATLFLRTWQGRTLVAPDAEVPISFGAEFGREVMRRFVGPGERVSIGDAVRLTTDRMLAADQPFGLLYGVHGCYDAAVLP